MPGTSTDVTVTEGSTPDQRPLNSVEIMTDGCGWFINWDMQRDNDGVGPTDPLVDYLTDRLDLPGKEDVRNANEYGEERHDKKPLPEWKSDPHTCSPSVGTPYASINNQIDAVWRSDSNEWIVDIPDEDDIVVRC